MARRHESRQQPQRQLERDVRGNVVQVVSEIMDQGYTLTEAAELLNLYPRTLRHWQVDLRDSLPVHLLGRPLQRASVQERNEVIDVLDHLGPATSVATLRDCFPFLARAELEDILFRYRRVWKKLNTHAVHCLRWPVLGRVWAIDFSEAPAPIDGLHRYLLAVRDLASHQQLLWLPVRDLSATTAQNALASLFIVHGAPLVLKMDNGPAFFAEVTRRLFIAWGVIPLFSPAYMPRYNGAMEAGIGSLKTRTERQASLQGHPGQWSSDDVAAARVEANATARPHGERGPTPDDLWQQRSVITQAERERFQTSVDHHRNLVRLEEGVSAEESLTSWELRSLDRKAIRRALVELGYLVFRRRRIPLPIKKQKVTKI